jgi:urease accessory protein UreF
MSALAIPQLASEIGPMLLPYLPYLLKGAKKAGDLATQVGQKLGEVNWDVVIKVWDKLRPQVEKQPEVKERLEEVAERKEDPRAETLLAWELEKILENLPSKDLQDIHNLIQQSQVETRTTIASGERSVAIGGDASNAQITTGDQMVQGKRKKGKKKG